MRKIIFILAMAPLFVMAQTNTVFIKLTGAGGKLIKGEVVMKGFEGAIQASTINSGGKNNTQTSFTMEVNGASADLKRAMASSEVLSKAEVTVLSPVRTMGAPIVAYTIKMEQIRVTGCTEAMGCNSIMSTSVTLEATRIGWTYYSTGKTGVNTVSKKYGWDADAGTEWTNF